MELKAFTMSLGHQYKQGILLWSWELRVLVKCKNGHKAIKENNMKKIVIPLIIVAIMILLYGYVQWRNDAKIVFGLPYGLYRWKKLLFRQKVH